DEEDEEDEEDEDEEEEEEEEAERETHEPSEIEMRQRLRLLHTMSSVSSMGEAATLLNRAMLNTACGRFEDALCLLDDVLGMASTETTSVEEARMQARAAKVKGTVLQEMGLMKEASVWYELSVRAGRRLLQQAPLSEDLRKYFPSLRYVHNQLAQFYLSVRAFALVLEHFEQLVALTDDAGDRRRLLREFERLSLEHDFWQDVTPGMLDQELEQGRRWYREKCWEEAALQFRRVVQLARLASFSSGDGTRMVEARALGNYATVLKDLRRCDESILAYRLCCRLLEELEEEQMERRMLNGLSLSLIEAHRYEDAAVVCERLLVLTERDDNVELVKTRLEEIQACLRDGRRTMERESVDEGNEETR
ncbi:tpr domain-containing protein, partial [Nannochloropsis gaditana CCMP526]